MAIISVCTSPDVSRSYSAPTVEKTTSMIPIFLYGGAVNVMTIGMDVLFLLSH
jgi:hypothetical protein